MEKEPVAYSTCDPTKGGTPKCGLGCVSKNFKVEHFGMPFDIFYDRIQTRTSPAKRGLALGRQYDVLVLLEGISEEEDRSDLPLTGSMANRFIDCVNQAGFASSQIYVTNMVKCAPPKGRKASQREIKSCLSHFRFELEKVNPKVVLLVGATTMKAFNLDKEGGIYKNRGKIFMVKFPGWEDGPTFKVIPTFHPSMFFYKNDPVAENRMRDDYILAAKVVRGDKLVSPSNTKSFKLIKTTDQFNQMVDDIKKHPLVAFDTESRNLQFRNNPIITMSFCWGYDGTGNQTAVLPIYRHSPTPNKLGWHLEPYWGIHKIRAPLSYIFNSLKTNIFENDKISKAAHNITHDWKLLRKDLQSEIEGPIYDTMVMHHLIREQKPHNLKYLADLELAIGNYDANLQKVADNVDNWDEIPDHLIWPYAAVDAENVFRLTNIYNYKILERSIKENPKLASLYFDRSIPAIKAVLDMEWAGIKMNEKKIHSFIALYTKEQNQILTSLRLQTHNSKFNPLSTTDVKNAAVEAGFANEITNTTKTSGVSTDRKTLMELSSKWDLAEKILNYRTNRKMISTYLEKALTDLDPTDSRIRKSFLLTGTESGRLSCSFLHQIPKPTKSRLANLRDLFEAEQGYLFGYMDYKQIELKVYAILIYLITGDDSLVKIFFDPNSDAHRTMASILLDIEEDRISDLNRDLGKTFNFGAIFGSSGSDLVGKGYETINNIKKIMDWDMVRRGIQRFHAMYPSVRNYMDLIPSIARNQNNTYINVFGRERHLGDALNSRDVNKREKSERELINFTVQSVAAQVNIDTSSLISEQIRSFVKAGSLKPGHMKIVNTVHDSTKTEFHEKLKHWATTFMKNVAERPIPELNNSIFTVDIGVGKTWSEAESKKNKI